MVPPSRSLGSGARTGLLLALVVLGAGAAHGLIGAAGELAAQGYLGLGLSRNSFLVVRDLPRASVAGAVPWALACLVVVSSSRIAIERRSRRALNAARVEELALDPSLRGWWVAAALAVGAGVVALEPRGIDERPLRAAATCVAPALITHFALTWLASLARSAAADARRLADVRAVLAGFATLGAFALGAGVEHAQRQDSRAATVVLEVGAVVAVLLALWTRRRTLAELSGTPRSPWSGPWAASAAFGALLAAFPFALGSFDRSLGAPTLTAKSPLNVLVIGIDTLRADALSLDGFNARGRDTSPNLRELAQRGIRFDDALSQSSWTLPSFASILTGRYPHEHGAYSMTGRLPERALTLAELMREAGHRTIGVVSQVYLREGSGFEQGCDVFDASPSAFERGVSSERATTAAQRAINGGAGPWFAFVHYFDPHADYLDHPEWPWADGYRGWLREQISADALERNAHLFGPDERKFLLDLYDEEVAFTDREIGRLIEGLHEAGSLHDTLIVVVADHGEQFLERGSVGHVTNLYDELVRVPLLVVPPDSTTGERFAGLVETRALFGTILECLGVDAAAEARARSVLRRARGDGEAARAFSIVWLPDAQVSSGKRVRISAVRDGRWKLIRDWTRERAALYDLEADSGEREDVAQRHADVAKELGDVLSVWTNEQQRIGSGAARRDMSASEREALDALGYLGGRAK
jgi:arylsulfatase A-like enzyme